MADPDNRHPPVRPAGQVDAEHWSQVGGAFGVRLAFLVEHAPPYYALYGLVRAGLVCRAWADRTAAKFPSHHGLSDEQTTRSLQLRPSLSGWLDLGAAPPSGPATAHEPILTDFFDRLIAYLRRYAPPGRLAARGVEAGLARACWLLAGWESAYRGRQLPIELETVHSSGDYTVEDLRRQPSSEVVEDLVALADTLRRSDTLRRWQQFYDLTPGQPLGVATPVLVHHWADGDVVVGAELVEVKAVLRLDQVQRTVQWPWQLLAYTWLDTADRYRIGAVGLYLARHGVLLSWGATTFADHLLGRTGAAPQARDEFLALAREVIAREGADPPGAWTPRLHRIADHVAPTPEP